MTIARLETAILNNIAWCEAIARSHGLPSERHTDAWLCRQPMPPFYPNLVTLNSTQAQLERIANLAEQLPVGWGVKDSYKILDLQPLNFDLKFEAQWYAREPDAQWPNHPQMNLKVQKVQTETDLAAWVQAWGETPLDTPIFVPQILEDDNVEFLFIAQDQEIIAGMVANRSECALGISNSFGNSQGIVACVRSLAMQYKHLTIVGYGSTEEIAFLRRFGFEAIGELRIWTKG